MKNKVGLVFGGGGGKGAYQIGVWRALREACIDSKIDAIAGTSIGALNGALFCMGDLAKAEKVWAAISPEQVLTKQDIHDYCEAFLYYEKGACEDGWFSNAGLRELIDNNIRPNILKHGPRDFYVTAAKLKKSPLFYNYVKKHSDTQFIIITHRRGTMEVADIMYGVTMQEKGVSSFLKVDINDVEKKTGVKL